MRNEETVKVLNDLIQTSEDGKRGFSEASKKTTKPELKSLFQGRSACCATAVIELRQLVELLGGTPKRSGTVAGTVHRAWATVTMVLGDANLVVLEELDRVEDKAVAVYVRALGAVLPRHIQIVVHRQHHGVVSNRNLIRDLRISYKVVYGNGAAGGFRRYNV